MELDRRAQSVSSQSTMNSELSNWLDQNQNPSLDEKQELGFTSALYRANLSLLAEIYKQCRVGSRCPPESLVRLSQDLERFMLLSEVLEHREIDICLGKEPEISDALVKMLYHVGRTLIKGAARLQAFFAKKWSDGRLQKYLNDVAIQIEQVRFVLSPGDDGGDIVEDVTVMEDESLNTAADIQSNDEIDTYITGLADLVPTLQDRLHEEARATEGRGGRAGTMTFHVTDSAKQYVIQIRDKYPKAPTPLVERLGEANWQRYVRIRRKMHQGESSEEEPGGEERFRSFQSTFVPTEFHDSGLGSSVAFAPHVTRSVASHTSFMSSHADHDKGRLRVPHTPGEVFGGVAFTCWICGSQLSSIRNRIDWKIHVFQDLQPYICTFDGCSDALTTFPTRKRWAKHEFREHRVTRFLKCYCSRTFTNKEIFERHLRYEHLLVLHDTQLRTQLAAAEMAVEQPLHEQICPLCLQDRQFGKESWASQRQFIEHVGRHLEEIALASLPRDIESDTEANSQRSGSSTPLHTSMRNHVRSVSVQSKSHTDTAWKNQQDGSTAVHVTRSPPEGPDAQTRTPNEERLHQSWGSFQNIAASTAVIDTQSQSNLQASNRHRVNDHAGWADSIAEQEDLLAPDPLLEGPQSSTGQSLHSELYSAINPSSGMTWLRPDDRAPRLQPHVPHEQGPIASQFTLPYYEQSAVNSYLTTSPRALYGQTDFHEPRLSGEYSYNSPHPAQDYVETPINSSDLNNIQPGAHHQLLPQSANGTNLAVQQPVRYEEPSQLYPDGSIEQYMALSLEKDSVPWTSSRFNLAPPSRKLGKRRKGQLQQSNDSGQGSASLEPDKTRSPRHMATVSEPSRAVKRRRLVREPGAPNTLSHNLLWGEIPSRTEVSGSRLAAVTALDTGSAFELPEAFEKPRGSNSIASEVPQSVPRLPSAPVAGARRGRTPRSRARQVSTQAEYTDLNPYRQVISSMYLAQGNTLVQIMDFMRDAYGVVASAKQFKGYLKRAHIMKNFNIDDVGLMLSLRKDVEDRGQRCKIYWCDKEVTQAKIESYLRKKKVTEAQVLAKATIPDPIPSHIVVEVVPHNAEASPTLPNASLDPHGPHLHPPPFPSPPTTERPPPPGPGPPRRRACVACRRSKAKCDFSDGEGSSAPSCIRCRQEHKDCVVRQPRRKRTPPVTRRSGKRKRAPSTTPEASSTSETSASIDAYHVADDEDEAFVNLVDGANFGSDDSV